jgi:hypothetical protein
VQTDPELSNWIEQWREQSTPAPPPATLLARRVRRRTLGLYALAAGELVLTAWVCVFMAWVLRRSAGWPDHLAMAGLAAASLGALAFTFWNRRGVWRSSASTTLEFLAFSLLRCRRRRRSLRFGWWLLAFEVAVLGSWLAHRGAGVQGYALLAAVAGAVALVLSWLGRRTRREIAELAAMSRETEA